MAGEEVPLAMLRVRCHGPTLPQAEMLDEFHSEMDEAEGNMEVVLISD